MLIALIDKFCVNPIDPEASMTEIIEREAFYFLINI